MEPLFASARVKQRPSVLCPSLRLFDVQSGTASMVCKDEGRTELPLLCRIISTVPLDSTCPQRICTRQTTCSVLSLILSCVSPGIEHKHIQSHQTRKQELASIRSKRKAALFTVYTYNSLGFLFYFIISVHYCYLEILTAVKLHSVVCGV